MTVHFPPLNDPDRNARSAVVSLDLEAAFYDGTPVLGPLNLTILPRETVAICGPSGIGKSTLLRILGGLNQQYRGTLQAPDRVAFVFQEPTLMPWRTARDNIVLTTRISREEADAALSEVGLDGFGDRFPAQLSLGQQRRVALARAFAYAPDLLLLDEPFVSLDQQLCDEMMEIFEELQARSTVTTVLVTHAKREARRLADRILTLTGSPARFEADAQDIGMNFQLSASGVASSGS